MLPIRTVLRPRLLARLRRSLAFAIEAVEGTGPIAWAPLYFMMVMMGWTMAFLIVRFMPRQMQIRSFMLVGGTPRITASILGFMSGFIIRMAIAHIMGT